MTMCLTGIDGCDCDTFIDGTVATFCECHDCYTCGAVDCDGHQEQR